LSQPAIPTALRRSDLASDPVDQFRRWFLQAEAAQPDLPEAMTLATADAGGRPSARMVLLKGFDERGFVFYTNRTSRKGRELSQNPGAALLFWWPALERQVRIEGRVGWVSEEESESYFQTRPRGSQLSAWASEQSSVVNDDALPARLRALEQEYLDKDVIRPPQWGGFRVVPEYFEFWQGKPNRLHDRFRYRRHQKGWIIERLAP